VGARRIVTDRNPFAHDALGSALVEPDEAAALNRIESLDTEDKRIEESRRQYEVALEIRRELTRQNPAYLPTMPHVEQPRNLDRIQAGWRRPSALRGGFGHSSATPAAKHRTRSTGTGHGAEQLGF